MKTTVNVLWKIVWAAFKYTLIAILYVLTTFFGIIYFMLGGDEEIPRNDSEQNKLVPIFDSKGRMHHARQGSPTYHQILGE